VISKTFDEYRTTGNLAPKGIPAEPRDLDADAAQTGVQLLPIYLREMGQTPLLQREDEVRLARQLQEAREAIAAVMRKLPAECRRYVLEDDIRGPRQGYRWPLDRLEDACTRLAGYVKKERQPAVQALLDEVRRHKRLLDDARDALIVANLRLVTHIVKKYGNQGIPFMDLIQEGNIGLMRAVEKFEYERGYKFSTYAYWWIKQAISRAIADKARIIRIPVHISEKVKRVKKVANELRDELGRVPTNREIARKLRMSIKKVDEILGVVQDPQPLDSFGSEEDAGGVLPFVRDESAVDPLEHALDRELAVKMRAALQVLDEREREVIRLRYGIGREMRHTLEEIGQVLHLSRERVRQIEAIALRKIEATEESQSLRSHRTGIR